MVFGKNLNNPKLLLVRRILLVILGSFIMALNVNSFVHSAGLFPGGFTGVTLLLQEIFLKYLNVHIPYSVVLYAFNVIPVFIGFKFIGKKFTILSLLMIILSGLLTDLLANIAWLNITNDFLLCAVFGGIVNAVAVCCCLLAGSSSGGTDFIAIFISEKTGKSAWGYILSFNVCVLVAAGLLLGWNKALYSIIFQYVSTQTINLIYKKYAKTTLLIITDKPTEIYEIIKANTNHDVTVFEGRGGYSGSIHQMVYTVVATSESGALEKEIRKVDPNAFINVMESKEIIGRFFKRAND